MDTEQGNASQQRGEDHELVALVAEKDKKAFEQLYKRYYHRVFQFAFRMVKDRQVVEEVVDDTLFAVWKSAGNFQGRSAVSTWIFGIAYRRSLKALESGRRHQGVEANLERVHAEMDLHPDTDPAAAALSRDLHAQLKVGIDQLSDDHRAVMLLTIMGYNYTEIAAVVDCPANTVKTRMFHARRNLKGLLTDRALEALTTQKDLWTHNASIS